MALAWHQIFQRNTTLSVAEIEQYDAQNEIAYGEYLRNLPLEYANPPLPTIPQGFGPPLPTNNPYSSQAIQVIVNQEACTEKESVITLHFERLAGSSPKSVGTNPLGNLSSCRNPQIQK